MITLQKAKQPPLAAIFLFSLLFIMVLIGLMFIYIEVFFINDFSLYFHDSAALFFQGQNPYQVPGIFTPPWLNLLFGPLLLLPEPLAAAVLTLANLVALSFLLYRSKASLPVLFMALFSPVTLYMVRTSNVDALLLLGVMLPPQWGLILLLTKPQLGMGIAVYWAWEAFRSGGIRKLIKIFAPITIAYAVSFSIYGFYILEGRSAIDTAWNANLYFFPYLIPVAIILLIAAIRRKQVSLTYGVAALASPYASPNSYIGLIPSFAWDWRWAFGVWIIEWAVFFAAIILHFR